MDILAYNIKHYRKLNNFTQAELASRLKVKPTAISAWEVGRNKPLMDKIELMASLFNIKKSELLGEITLVENSTSNDIKDVSDQLHPPRQKKVLNYAKEQLAEQQKESQINEVLYPYHIVEKLAGASSLPNGYSYDADYNQTYTLYSDREITKQYDFASQVTGDSMEPDYQDGDVVLIKKGYDNTNGAIYAIDYDGKSYLKKVYLEDNKFRLVSLNDKYDDIYIYLPVEDDTYLNIIGKVVDSFTPVEV